LPDELTIFEDKLMTMIKTLGAVTVATFVLGSAAFAGTLEEPIVETAPAPTVAPVVASSDWTGLYGGLNLGYGDYDADGGLDGDDVTYGVHFGYDYDFGDYVLGAEIEYDESDISLGGGEEINNVTRGKLRAGYDLGNTLVYATAGVAYVDTSFGNQTGGFAGVGAAYKATENITVGGEILQNRFNNVGSTTNDIDATTFNLRLGYRF